jgi:hypothetical protein
MAAPSLQIQTVLYENPPSQVTKWLESFEAAVAMARSLNVLGAVSVAIGDCSDSPVIDDVAEFKGMFGTTFSSLDYEYFGDNLGSGGGHNRLFEALDSEFVLVVNPDTYASPNLLVELMDPFDDLSVGIVEPRQVPLEQPKVHDPATGDTSWASGSCFAARASLVSAIGGFDSELFFLYCDDVDFSWRARLDGWRVVHRPAAAIFHDKRVTTSGQLRASDIEIFLGAEASVLMPWRYSRPDVAERKLKELEASPDTRHQQAAVRLRARLDAGDVPTPIDIENRVAQFIGVGNAYADHRWW